MIDPTQIAMIPDQECPALDRELLWRDVCSTSDGNVPMEEDWASTDRSHSAGMCKSGGKLDMDCETLPRGRTWKVYAMMTPLVAYRDLTWDKDTG